MSSKRKGKDDKDKKKSWQVIRSKFQLYKNFDNEYLSGFRFWPQFGTSKTVGNYKIYDDCGSDIIDPASIQGTRIIKDLKIKVSQHYNQIGKNILVVVYKYNKAYGGSPCCDYTPEPNEVIQEGWYSFNTMNNYQSVLGQTTFSSGDDTEHIICVEDEVILEEGDRIRVSFGNMPYFGSIVTQPAPIYFQWLSELVNGKIGVTGTVEGAIAFL